MLIAILPFLAHRGDGRLTALNIGMGTGATARTLAKSLRVESVDTYEIVRTVRELLVRYPLYTLTPFELRKINIYWEDARSGLIRAPNEVRHYHAVAPLSETSRQQPAPVS